MRAALHFTTGVWAGRDIPLRQPETTIGRGPTADIVIPVEDQRFVSRVHASIVVQDGCCVAQDLGSSNGTWVNGARIQQAVLNDGDRIQFGRQGPVAQFRERVPILPAHDAGAEVVREHDEATRPRERPSQIVGRLVNEAMAANTRRAGRRLAGAVACLVLAAAAAVWAIASFGIPDWNERTFRRLEAEYQNRVVLVEVGISYNGRYSPIGNGTGFFAASGGLIVTNKHVVYSHLYDEGVACIAESFRRHGLAFEQALVLTVWPGGSQFRQTSASSSDLGLGYSTAHQTLALAAVAADHLMPPAGINCRDTFGGSGFTYAWRRHAVDNNDLAVLRASASVPPIPLADTEPAADAAVMVFGFPTGTVPLETTTAEPIRRVGRVLRTRDTIQIDAVVLGGNSGGPLIDTSGRVVGITTRGTAESLNMAIKAEYVRRLIEQAQPAR
jgi:S1-C subfamily serine protease